MWTELNRRCDTDMGDHEDVELNPCQIDTFVPSWWARRTGAPSTAPPAGPLSCRRSIPFP